MELWKTDESFQGLKARLKGKREGLSLVTFDFFDTLVSRVCAEPADLFIEVARRLRAGNLLNGDWSPDAFRAARIAADERARDQSNIRGKGQEVELLEIYSQLVPHVVRDAEQARQVEFCVERAVCYPNPSVLSLARHVRGLGCKTAIVSDTYLRASELRHILQANGVEQGLFDEVIVSCEARKAKWNGQLYYDVIKRFDLHPSEILHIGDNEAADIRMAAAIGIEAVHYYKATPVHEATFEREAAQAGAARRAAGSLNSLRIQVSRHAASASDASRDGAMVFGPVLSRFADWSAEQFQKAGVRKVLALMREGELLGDLLANAAAASGIELEVVPCYASRLATALPSMPKVGPHEVAELIEGSGPITPQTILNIVGLGDMGASYMDGRMLQSSLQSTESVAGFLRLMFDMPRITAEIESRRAEAHSLALKYFSALVGEHSVIGVLDLGWSASIQRNIARILRRGGRHIRTAGCYLACTARAGRLALEGDSAQGYFPQEWDRSAILPEVAITACVGSTDGYKKDDSGKVAPVLGAYEISPKNREVKRQLRDGILNFQERWLTLRKEKSKDWSPELLHEIDHESQTILFRLLDYPHSSEAKRLGTLEHDENYFGKNYTAPLCDERSLLRLKQDGVAGIIAAAKCYWPQGVLAQANPRITSALSCGWRKMHSLGRLGAWSGPGAQDCGVTSEESVALIAALRSIRADKLVYCGLASSTLKTDLSAVFNAQQNGNSHRVVIANPAWSTPVTEPLQCHYAQVQLSIDDGESLRLVREQLAESNRVVLALTYDFTANQIQAILRVLAPFLGAEGVIMYPNGVHDTKTAKLECPTSSAVQAWLETEGEVMGFEQRDLGSSMLHAYWTVLVRSPRRQAWSKGWELSASDFEQTCELATTP